LVLASDIAVFREVAGEAAIYFDPSDTQDMSAVLESALDSPTRDVIISRGCARIARFGWDACADQTYAVYGKALAGKRIG
jgi:glycosyltransferase involved in cell wall biosynthesis